MNGVHDLGGMHGMGPIQPEKNEPVFHEPWEARAFALTFGASAWRKWNLDASRFQREQFPPADYFRMTYYERWTEGLVGLMLKAGLVTTAELESGRPDPTMPRLTPPLTAQVVPTLVRTGRPSRRDVAVAA